MVGFLLSGAALEGLNRHFIRTRSRDALLMRAFERMRPQVETLLVGDSHMADGVDARVIEGRAFNLAIRGANYIQLYYLLRSQIDRMPALRRVVIAVELHTLSEFRTKRGFGTPFWRRYVDEGARRELEAVGIQVRRSPLFLTIASKSLGQRAFLANIAAGFTMQPASRMTAGLNRTLGARPRRRGFAVERARSHFEGKIIGDSAMTLYLERIVTLCRDRGVKVVTVQLPLSRAYLKEALRLTGGGIVLDRTLGDLRRKHLIVGNLDYRELFSDRNGLFKKDGDHVSSRGRRLFSHRLREDLAGMPSAN